MNIPEDESLRLIAMAVNQAKRWTTDDEYQGVASLAAWEAIIAYTPAVKVSIRTYVWRKVRQKLVRAMSANKRISTNFTSLNYIPQREYPPIECIPDKYVKTANLFYVEKLGLLGIAEKEGKTLAAVKRELRAIRGYLLGE